MAVLVGFVVGVLAVRLVVNTCRGLLQAPVLQRENHRGRSIPTAAGLFAVAAVLLVEAGRAVVGAFGIGTPPTLNGARAAMVFACVGYALLGFVDDVVGDQYDHGFRGHLRALASGRVTTGAVKIVGGSALARRAREQRPGAEIGRCSSSTTRRSSRSRRTSPICSTVHRAAR